MHRQFSVLRQSPYAGVCSSSISARCFLLPIVMEISCLRSGGQEIRASEREGERKHRESRKEQKMERRSTETDFVIYFLMILLYFPPDDLSITILASPLELSVCMTQLHCLEHVLEFPGTIIQYPSCVKCQESHFGDSPYFISVPHVLLFHQEEFPGGNMWSPGRSVVAGWMDNSGVVKRPNEKQATMGATHT